MLQVLRIAELPPATSIRLETTMLDLGLWRSNMTIIGTVEGMNEVELYEADGRVLQLVGDAVPVAYVHGGKEVMTDRKTYEERVNVGEAHGLINGEEKEMTEDEKILAEAERLQKELEMLKSEEKIEVAPSTEVKEKSNVKKNQKPGKADPNRKYTRIGELKTWGKVPQQQADLAAIMAESMDVDAEWTEEELFDLVATSAKEYASLRNSKQDPTYLFRYYRGLKNDGKHAGFVARNFLRMV